MKNQLDEQGYIVNCASLDKVHFEFLPLVEAVTLALQKTLGNNLHSLYAYGSIPEGRAEIGKSDADFLIVLNEPLQDGEQVLSKLSKDIHKRYARLVSKIDLPSVTLDEVMASREVWGSYLKTICLPLYGPDLRKSFPNFKPSLALAKGWNGDLRMYLEKTLEMLRSDTSEQEKQERIRGISGKIIRSFFMLIAPEIQYWSPVFTNQALKVIEHFEEQREDFRYLVMARRDGKPVEEFLVFLEKVEKELLPIFEAGIAGESAS